MEVKTFYYNKLFKLESGEELAEFKIGYTTLGKLNKEKDNVVWICHALTGNADPSDWWNGLVGEGRFFDPNKYFIVCANVLGSCYGSTNALDNNSQTNEPYFHTFPLITIRDIVNSFEELRKFIGIDKIKLCIGGSLGAMQALEWSIMYKDVIESMAIIAVNARHSAWGIAFNEAQRMAIESDQSWRQNHHEAGKEGMRAARALALLSYRNYATYDLTQSDPDDDKIDDFQASSYERYQGEKLYRRFNAFSYWSLSKTMDSHNIGRGRNGLEETLREIKVNTLVIGISSDFLFPIHEQKFLAENIPNALFSEIDSIYGHDGFLIENEQISNCLKLFLEKNKTSDVILK